MEQVPLFNAANFSPKPTSEGLAANRTVMGTSIAMFICPSDGVLPVEGYGRVNYRMNIGPSIGSSFEASTRNGPFCSFDCIGPANFTDGLSNTVGSSERLQGDWTKGTFRSGGDYRLAGPVQSWDEVRDIDRAVVRCRSASAMPAESRGGESWFLSGLHFTEYNHGSRPNSDGECAFETDLGLMSVRANAAGVIGSSSSHPGGVNTLRMDGSVRHVKDQVDLRLWRALGTRSGGEIISAE